MLVVKIGGAAGIEYEPLCRDIARLQAAGEQVVLMHGGSDGASQLGEALGHPPRFVQSPSGHVSRYTDRRTLEIFMLATGLLNRQLVETLQHNGINAWGLSGIDGGLLRGRRKSTIRIVEDGRQLVLRDDWTGTVDQVNQALLATLLQAGYTPVVAPLALSELGEALNIDGDRGAAALAGAVNAHTLVLLSNVPGLLRDIDDPSSVISHIPRAALADYEPVAQGRMKKKLLGAREALAAGVEQVIIADARHATPLQAALAAKGTVIA